METRADNIIPPDIMADAEAVCQQVAAFGRVTDPELLRRVQERSRKAQEASRKYGLVDIGVPAIRALRDGEDE